MRINIGDLVYIKQNSYLSGRHNDELWLAIGITPRPDSQLGAWVRLENVHNGNKVTYRETMLMKIDTEASC
jgi:glycine cleavage system H lipoate-binding protein